MWRIHKQGLKTLPGLEELRKQRREQEAALRKARREHQLISKRLLRDVRDESYEDLESHCVSEQQIIEVIKDLKQRPAEKIESLISLRHYLQRADVRLMFIRTDGSMQLLIGLFTCSFADVQMEAARCLHELSQSDDALVFKSCLSATPYLLTYLSGNSPKLSEICLYTLGNIIVDGEATRQHLLAQGIIPALALCTQSPHVNVLEAVGYTLSQLLDSKEASEKIIPVVLESGFIKEIFRILFVFSEERLGVAVEFAWCLYYTMCSQVNNTMLISLGIVPKLLHLLTDLCVVVSKTPPPDLELLICPLVRCVAYLLTEVDSAGNKIQIQDARLLVALFAFMRQYHKAHPFMLRECLLALVNVTVENPVGCSAVLHYNLLPVLLHFLLHSSEVTVLVLTILCNIADLGSAYCQILREKNLLLCVISALGGANEKVICRSLDLLVILFRNCPDFAGDFLNQFGLKTLEPYKNNPEFHRHMEILWNQCTTLVGKDIENIQTME
ncbi:transmembrane and coiled-coil domain-containing protein 6 [Pelodytes ibericus]